MAFATLKAAVKAVRETLRKQGITLPKDEYKATILEVAEDIGKYDAACEIARFGEVYHA